ncbi:hypothetical protein L218DRAFT_331203 [Marasmius fiardii PR-910]|nr:hypothetical protein L218DRAFT_331203 [Marasmius fiardii PR-910]
MRLHTFISFIFFLAVFITLASSKATLHQEPQAAVARAVDSGLDNPSTPLPPSNIDDVKDGKAQKKGRPLRFFRPRNHP